MNKYILSFILLTSLFSCEEKIEKSDAYGNFEATTTTISAEANGKLLYLNVKEGAPLQKGALVGLVDTTLLHLQRRQLEAQIGILPQKLQTDLAEIEVLERQQVNLIRERDRFKRLIDKKAATQKQVDDLNGEIEVVNKRIAAVKTQTNTANRSILAEKEPLLAQIDVIEEQIRKSYIINPLDGIILTKLSEPNEMIAAGTPLYRIADLDTITLKFYVSSQQLQQLKLGATIEVLIDYQENELKSLEGMVSHIANEAEFTPKTIQTREDRVNLVYAVEARVPNPDGLLKIGMPAEVNFTFNTQNVTLN